MKAITWFKDREAAGSALVEKLERYRKSDAVIVALPRGGVPVAAAVAEELELEMDILIVRKLGFPGQPELALGAIGPDGVIVLNEWILSGFPNPKEVVRSVVAKETLELQRREKLYRKDKEALPLQGREVILVDDGLATGASMRAAVQVLRKLAVRRCIVAVPVAAPDALAMISEEADEAICVLAPEDFRSVGQFYQDFSQTTDEEVAWILQQKTDRHS